MKCGVGVSKRWHDGLKRAASLFLAIVLVAGLCVTPAFAEPSTASVGQTVLGGGSALDRSSAEGASGEEAASAESTVSEKNDSANDGGTVDATETPATDASPSAEAPDNGVSSQVQPSDDSSLAANDAAAPPAASADQAAAAQAQVDLGAFVAPDSSSLGSLDHFGVFARTYAPEGSDMEANIASELFVPNGSDIGASNAVKGLSGEHPLNYFVDVQGLGNIKYQRSSVEDTYLVFGPDIALTEKAADSTTPVGSGASTGTGRVTTDKTVNIADSTFQIDFDQAFAGLSSYASAQHARSDTGVSVKKSYGEGIDHNNWTITVSCDDGDDVVNLTKWELENCKLNVVASQTGAYSLIVNVSDAADGDDVTLGESKGMSIDGNDYDSYGAIAGKVLFNFGTSAGTYTFKKYQMGVALAPNGTVVCDSYSHNGCMYASTVKNLNCELHQRSFTSRSVVPPTPREGSLEILKTTVGGATPADAEFTIAGPNGFSKTVRYFESENGSLTIDGLVPGEYTVKESNADVEGYGLTVTGDGQAVAVAAGKAVEAHITNTYTPPTPPEEQTPPPTPPEDQTPPPTPPKEQTPPPDTPKHHTPTHKSPSASPKTGDLAPLPAVAGAVVAAGAIAAFAARKRRTR